MGWRGVKAPPRRGSQAGPAGGRQVSSVSEQGGGRQVPQRALRRELGTRVTKGMLSKTPGSGLVQEIQGLPQQLGTPAPNGPKIPSADKGILSAPGSSRQVGGWKPEGESLHLSALIGQVVFGVPFPGASRRVGGLLWQDLPVRLPPTQAPEVSPSRGPDTSCNLVTQLRSLGRW